MSRLLKLWHNKRPGLPLQEKDPCDWLVRLNKAADFTVVWAAECWQYLARNSDVANTNAATSWTST
jgi:hypothetical protein